MDGLKKAVNSYKKIDKRITNENKKSIINEMNRHAKDYGFEKLRKDATAADVQRAKNVYLDRIGYDVVSMAVNEGNTVIAEIYGRDLKRAEDMDTAKLGQYAKDLAKAKKTASRKLTESEKQFLEKSNQNVLGFGNKDMVTAFEKLKTDKQIRDMIDTVKLEDPTEVLRNKHLDTFTKVFQKVGIMRHDDIEKLKAKLSEMGIEDMVEHTNVLLQSLEIYGSPKNRSGKWNANDTELSNARLDDMMIRTGLKDTGKRKVKSTYKKYSQ